jgi:RND family efflux transporter MFP subunit
MKLADPRFWLPVAILAVGVGGVALLVASRPEVEVRERPEAAPLVRVLEAQPTTWQYVVRTQGTVEPRTESELIPQVSGEVEWISPALVSGGFFEKGDPLVRIEPSDYEVELQAARAAVARAESEFERSETERARQRALLERGVASQARIDDAENAWRVAGAALREARARRERAERDLARTVLRAPFEGRVRAEQVDVGQFVNRGQSVGTLYAVDAAEVVLPIPDRELRYLDVPLGRGRTGDADDPGPAVILRAEFAGEDHAWEGRVVRTEGEIDAKSRMVNLVARVEDPYGLHHEKAGGRPPLAVGLFVNAEILGREVDGVYVLPREALRPGDPMDPEARDELHVVDADGRLRIRPVDVLRGEREHVVIGEGLSPGERVSLSPMQAVVDGMRVRVVGDEAGGADGEPDAGPVGPEDDALAAAGGPRS